MSRRRKNIRKRNDRRWEAHLLLGNKGGKAHYKYLYAQSYAEVKRKKAELMRTPDFSFSATNESFFQNPIGFVA